MALSNDLISQFVKATRDKQEVKKESTAYGKIVKQGDKTYVQLDGSDLLTPISSTTVVRDEDRVMVTIKNHTAIVTGDFTNPSANDKDVQEIGSKISEFEIIIADKVSTKELEAEIAKIDKIIADDIEATNAKFETIEGKVAEIDTIKADVIEVEEKITAHEGEFTTIRGDIADFKDLTTENIEAINGNFHTLESDYADFKVVTTNKITANEGAIDDLETKKLDAESAEIKYANIDFANIGEAAIRKLFSDSGIIKDLIMSDGKVTGELVGVTIKGDIIEGNTVKADKLVILGEDGLYYKLNVNALGESTASSDEKYQNGLDGSIIVAESITAEKIAVDDLVAFGATIGGYHITDHSLYSGVKSSVSNTTQGVYLGDDGQVAIGDSNNYLKFFVDENGQYKLEIKASSIEFGANDSPLNDLKIGGRNLLLNSKEGYSYTDSNNVSEINDKLVTILSTGEGYSSCSIKDKISIPLTDFLTKNNEPIALSLDTKVTGSFTNLQYAIKVELENVSSTFPILSIPDACKKNTWFRIDGVDKSIKWPQFFNYEDYKSKSVTISLDENGWFIANCNHTNGNPGTTANYTCSMNILNNIRPNSKYNIFIEVKDVVGEGKITLLNNTGWTHFKNDHSVNINESSNGLIVNFISPTRSDFSNINYGLYIAVAVAGGKSCSAKFRISIIEDLDITPENFIYKPYVSEDMEPIDVLLVTSWDNAEVGSTAEYRLPKLELGTIASQWTPAPEDTEKSIDDVVNDITNNYYTKTETDANFSIQSDRITSAVSKIEIVEKSIDDIEIGGRNLALRTKTLEDLGDDNTYRFFKPYGVSAKYERDDGFFECRGTSNWKGLTTNPVPYNLKDGDKITVSLNVDAVHMYARISLFLMQHDANGTRKYYTFNANGQDTTNDSAILATVGPNTTNRLSVTIVWNQNLSNLIADGGRANITIQCSALVAETDTQNGYISFYAPKIELGTMATDWTPAPEDTESSIDDVKNDLTNNYYSKTETDSKFEIQSDKITSTVSKIEIVEKSINDIEIGGRNLLLNTSTEPITKTFSGWQSYLHGEFPFITKHLNRISNDQKLTLRAYLENTSGTEDIGLMIHFYLQNDTKEFVQIVSDEKIKPGESGWVTVTDSLYDKYNGVTGSIQEIRVAIRHYSSANATETTCNIHSVKLEIGNKPTDWTPAPEDMENNLTNNYYTKTETDSKFEIESDRITSTVRETISETIIIDANNLFLDSEIGYPYTNSSDNGIIDEKTITTSNYGPGYAYCSVKENLSLSVSDFIAKNGDSIAFSLDTKITGNFTNLKYWLKGVYNDMEWMRPLIEISDYCEKDTWFRISGMDKISNIKQLYNYEDVGRQTEGVTVDELGWITVNRSSLDENAPSRYDFYINATNLKPNTNYNIFLEILDISEDAEGGITVCSASYNTQFQDGWYVNFKDLNSGMITNKICLTKSSLNTSTIYSLATTISFDQDINTGDISSGMIVFRLSLIEDIAITPENFVYKEYQESSEELEDVIFYISWDTSDIGSTVEYKRPKLELGSKSTGWSPAPEDITNKLDEGYYTKDEVDNRFSISESTIQQLSNSISMLVRDSNGSSLMTQTSDGWVFSTDSIEKAIQDTLDGLGALSSEIGTTNGTVYALQKMVDNLSTTSEYVKIGAYQDEPCIELGESDSDFKLLITNTRILFLEGTNAPVYISNNSLYGKRFIVEDELQQGGFAWIEHGEGNLGLLWKGGN